MFLAVCVKFIRPDIPENRCPSSLSLLIQSCWAPNPLHRPTLTHIAEQLESIIIPECENHFYIRKINSSIEDHNARKFWELFFFTESQTSWKSFSEVFFPIRSNYEQLAGKTINFTNELPNPLPNIPSKEQLASASTEQLEELATRNRVGKALVAKELQTRKNSGYIAQNYSNEEDMIQEILCPVDKQIVTLQNFGSLIGWFAPLDNHFIIRVRDTVTNPYFQGRLSFEQSNSLLRRYISPNQRPCLVRFSGNTKNSFCICYVTTDTPPSIKHLVVTYRPQYGFSFNKNYYTTLQALMLAAQSELSFNRTCGECPFLRFVSNDEDDYF